MRPDSRARRTLGYSICLGLLLLLAWGGVFYLNARRMDGAVASWVAIERAVVAGAAEASAHWSLHRIPEGGDGGALVRESYALFLLPLARGQGIGSFLLRDGAFIRLDIPPDTPTPTPGAPLSLSGTEGDGPLPAPRPAWTVWREVEADGAHWSIGVFAGRVQIAAAAGVGRQLARDAALAGAISLVAVLLFLFHRRTRAQDRAVREHLSLEISRRMAELDSQGEELSRQISWRAQAERDLVESEERFLLALEATSDGLWDWNAATGAIYFTPRWYVMLGYRPYEFPPSLESWFDLVHPGDVERVRAAVERLGEGLGKKELAEEFRMRTQEGSWRWIQARGRVVSGGGDEIRVVGVNQDVHERRLMEERLRDLALSDQQTGLGNRLSCHEALVGLAAMPPREKGLRWAVIFIDLSRFKLVNESFGHAFGDELLREVGSRLALMAGEDDAAIRFGSDEFVLVLAAPDSGRAVIRALLAARAALARPFAVNGLELSMDACYGVVMDMGGTDTADGILQKANIALHRAKELGGGRIRVFSRRMLEEAQDRVRLEQALRRAVASGDIEVHYQPIHRAGSGEMAGFEALARWNGPDGPVRPDIFIPLAEESGLIHDLGLLVLRRACADFASWLADRGAEGRMAVSVNVSASQLLLSSLPESVERVLGEAGLAPGRLKLEVTESALMQDVKEAAGALERLRRLGVRISVDDFGTGYSSLSHLQRLSLDQLKIDLSFVRDMDRNLADVEIVKTVVELGHNLGLEVVAEGVERVEQRLMLEAIGCDCLQGWLFSRALPANEARAYLAERLPPAQDA